MSVLLSPANSNTPAVTKLYLNLHHGIMIPHYQYYNVTLWNIFHSVEILEI